MERMAVPLCLDLNWEGGCRVGATMHHRGRIHHRQDPSRGPSAREALRPAVHAITCTNAAIVDRGWWGRGGPNIHGTSLILGRRPGGLLALASSRTRLAVPCSPGAGEGGGGGGCHPFSLGPLACLRHLRRIK
jgi:hypothetical protein